MKKYNNYLPSAQQRWCTRNMKFIPLEHWIRDDLKKGITINSYVAIRYDEPYREGHQSKHDNFKVVLLVSKRFLSGGWDLCIEMFFNRHFSI